MKHDETCKEIREEPEPPGHFWLFTLQPEWANLPRFTGRGKLKVIKVEARFYHLAKLFLLFIIRDPRVSFSLLTLFRVNLDEKLTPIKLHCPHEHVHLRLRSTSLTEASLSHDIRLTSLLSHPSLLSPITLLKHSFFIYLGILEIWGFEPCADLKE